MQGNILEEYIGMFFENVSLRESFMKNTDLAGAIPADSRCVKADKTVSNAEVVTPIMVL